MDAMNIVTLDHISEILTGLPIPRLDTGVADFATRSRHLHEEIAAGAPPAPRTLAAMDEAAERLPPLADATDRLITGLLHGLVCFSPPAHLNGAGEAFRQVKRHQRESLSGLRDELGLLRDDLRRILTLQGLVRTYLEKLRHSAVYLDVMRERLTERPTAKLRMAGPGTLVARLNEGFSDIQAYENGCCQDLDATPPAQVVTGTVTPCLALIADIREGLPARRERLTRLYRETRDGHDLLRRIILQGDDCRAGVCRLMDRHQHRLDRFHLELRQCRECFSASR